MLIFQLTLRNIAEASAGRYHCYTATCEVSTQTEVIACIQKWVFHDFTRAWFPVLLACKKQISCTGQVGACVAMVKCL